MVVCWVGIVRGRDISVQSVIKNDSCFPENLKIVKVSIAVYYSGCCSLRVLQHLVDNLQSLSIRSHSNVLRDTNPNLFVYFISPGKPNTCFNIILKYNSIIDSVYSFTYFNEKRVEFLSEYGLLLDNHVVWKIRYQIITLDIQRSGC